MSEIEKIKSVYKSRDQNIYFGFRDHIDIIDSYYRERLTFEYLTENSFLSLREAKVVDMGSGFGARLRSMERFGAHPANLYGVDLSEQRTSIAKEFSPNMHFYCGDVSKTNFPSKSFDIVMNSTMMSSILDDALAGRIANEMKRLLKPGGIILWYDMRYDNPYNGNVRGYSKRKIRELFTGADFKFRSVTIPPSIIRRLPMPGWFYHLLHLMPLFRSHYLCVIRFNL